MFSEHSHIESCCISGDSVCRRAFNMNLALGYSEEFYSLPALAEKHSMTTDSLFDFAFEYVESRECFRKEWVKMISVDECPLVEKCVVDKCFTAEFEDL